MSNSFTGRDSNGTEYTNAEDMWKKELECADRYDKTNGWYGKALAYWEKTPATVSGVLGGMDHINARDLKASKAFIESIESVQRTRALDCGAGIGRISKALLMPMFATVDILEPVEHMVEQAKKELDPAKLGRVYLTSMEKAELPESTYDVIVIQWAAIYLTDEDFVSFLKNCKKALAPGGIIFFKENCSGDDTFLVDKDDSSLTRSDNHYKEIFKAAGVELIKEQMQPNWPSDLMAVKMYGLH